MRTFFAVFPFACRFLSVQTLRDLCGGLPNSLNDCRWLNRNCLALLRQNPRHDDFGRDLRDAEQIRSVRVLLQLLLGMHPVGHCEFYRVSGQADFDVGNLFVAYDLIECDGINNGLLRGERLVQYLRLFYAVDDKRAAFFPHMTVCFDAPFALIEEQNVRVYDAFRRRFAVHAVI